MLLKSGINLESETINFIKRQETITLFSAYIKLGELKKINNLKNIKQIIVRWEIRDLCLGVSDLELYDYCIENDIILYRNTRIHLKVFWNNSFDVLFGSANVSNRGLGEKGRYNYELNGLMSQVSFSDISYFNHILNESELVDEQLYKKIKEKITNCNSEKIEYPELNTVKKQIDYFLLSQLPMTLTVNELFEAYSCSVDNLTKDEILYISHDITLYSIQENLIKTEFIKHLKMQFNNHPFILSLKIYIESQVGQSLRYGGLVNWVKDNTTTVPIPRSWEIKQELIVNILMDWICYLDSDYTWSTPNYAQVIFYKPK